MSNYYDIQDVCILRRGDIIRGKSTGMVYVVTGHYGDRVTAVATQDITHASEWEVFRYDGDSPVGKSERQT